MEFRILIFRKDIMNDDLYKSYRLLFYWLGFVVSIRLGKDLFSSYKSENFMHEKR